MRISLSVGFYCHGSQATTANLFARIGGYTDTRSYDISVSYARAFGMRTNAARADFDPSTTGTHKRSRKNIHTLRAASRPALRRALPLRDGGQCKLSKSERLPKKVGDLATCFFRVIDGYAS
jgi:hypothetical protein